MFKINFYIFISLWFYQPSSWLRGVNIDCAYDVVRGRFYEQHSKLHTFSLCVNFDNWYLNWQHFGLRLKSSFQLLYLLSLKNEGGMRGGLSLYLNFAISLCTTQKNSAECFKHRLYLGDILFSDPKQFHWNGNCNCKTLHTRLLDWLTGWAAGWLDWLWSVMVIGDDGGDQK